VTSSIAFRVARLQLPLRTRRLLLELPARRHVPELLRWIDDAAIARWTLHIPRSYSPKDAAEHIRRARGGFREGSSISLQILRRSDRKLVGGIGLHDLDGTHLNAEVGYWLGRPFRGQGYAQEALRAIVRTAFRGLGLHRLTARVFLGNENSIRVLRHCGFRREGTLRDEVVKDGTFRSNHLFSLLSSDPIPPSQGSRRRSGRGPRGSA
jgi:[ribosomal protein S5]-alanine N-acetyltransferase